MSSDPDTVFVSLHIDKDPSFSGPQAKTNEFLSEGSCYWSKVLLIGLITFFIIGIILVLLFFIITKKLKKNKRSTTTGTTTTTKEVETKALSPHSAYQQVPNV